MVRTKSIVIVRSFHASVNRPVNGHYFLKVSFLKLGCSFPRFLGVPSCPKTCGIARCVCKEGYVREANDKNECRPFEFCMALQVIGKLLTMKKLFVCRQVLNNAPRTRRTPNVDKHASLLVKRCMTLPLVLRLARHHPARVTTTMFDTTVVAYFGQTVQVIVKRLIIPDVISV